MTHPNRRKQELEMEARRRKVAAILLAGVTDQMRIAEQFGVSQSTISRDITAIEAHWKNKATQDISAAKGKDLDRIDRLIQALWDDAIKGKWLATDRVIALMQHRARLLGLDAPVKHEDTQRIEVTMLIKRIAEEAGLDEGDIIKEAERILQETAV